MAPNKNKNTPKPKKSGAAEKEKKENKKEKSTVAEKPKQEKQTPAEKPKQQQEKVAVVENLKQGKPKQRVLSQDMGDELKKKALAIAAEALEKFDVEKDVAQYVKSEFDKCGRGEAWNCIVGRNFGTAITHESDNFIYFYSDQMAVLLFKS